MWLNLTGRDAATVSRDRRIPEVTNRPTGRDTLVFTLLKRNVDTCGPGPSKCGLMGSDLYPIRVCSHLYWELSPWDWSPKAHVNTRCEWGLRTWFLQGQFTETWKCTHPLLNKLSYIMASLTQCFKPKCLQPKWGHLDDTTGAAWRHVMFFLLFWYVWSLGHHWLQVYWFRCYKVYFWDSRSVLWTQTLHPPPPPPPPPLHRHSGDSMMSAFTFFCELSL